MKNLYTNAILTVIAVLLALIAAQLHMYRPVTMSEIVDLDEAGKEEAKAERILRIPMHTVHSVRNTVDVRIEP